MHGLNERDTNALHARFGLDPVVSRTAPDGLLDFRGQGLVDAVTADQWFRSRGMQPAFRYPVRIEDSAIEDVDFSGSDLSRVLFKRCTVRNCRFDRCDLVGMVVAGSRIEGCSFRRADLRSDVLLGMECDGAPALWDGCDFDGARIGGVADVSAFRSCSFRDVAMKRFEGNGSLFQDCVFSGRIVECRFWLAGLRSTVPPPDSLRQFDRCDFRGAVLEGLEVFGSSLDHAQLPTADHVVIEGWRDWHESAVKLLRGNTDTVAQDLARVLVAAEQNWTRQDLRTAIFEGKSTRKWIGQAGWDLLVSLSRT